MTVVPSQTCFVGLPISLVQQVGVIASSLVLRIRWDGANGEERVAHVGWGGSTTTGMALEVPAALAEALGLRPSTNKLHASVVRPQPPRASALHVRPETASDWDVIEGAAEHVRDQVLTQVNAAEVGQRLPLWVHGSECVWLVVLRAEPAAAVVTLGPGTDLIVAPPPTSAASAAATAQGGRAHGRDPKSLRVFQLRVGAWYDEEVGLEGSIERAG